VFPDSCPPDRDKRTWELREVAADEEGPFVPRVLCRISRFFVLRAGLGDQLRTCNFRKGNVESFRLLDIPMLI